MARTKQAGKAPARELTGWRGPGLRELLVIAHTAANAGRCGGVPCAPQGRRPELGAQYSIRSPPVGQGGGKAPSSSPRDFKQRRRVLPTRRCSLPTGFFKNTAHILHSQDRSIIPRTEVFPRRAARPIHQSRWRQALSRPRGSLLRSHRRYVGLIHPNALSEHAPIAHQGDVNVFTDHRAFDRTYSWRDLRKANQLTGGPNDTF